MKFILCFVIVLLSFISGALVYRGFALNKLSEVCMEFHENFKADDSNDVYIYSIGSFDTLARIAEKLG